jgi:hypothetical protein
MVVLYIVTAPALAASVCANHRKTPSALKIVLRWLVRILPACPTVLALFSLAVTPVPQQVIRDLLGRESGWLGVAVARAMGSIGLMPGLIALSFGCSRRIAAPPTCSKLSSTATRESKSALRRAR